MKTTSEILKELLKTSLQMRSFIETHSFKHTLSAENLRGTYAACLLYISIDWYRAVLVLTVNQLRGPAVTSIRPMFESWVKGTWIISVPSNDEIKRIATNNKPLKSKEVWELIDELKVKNIALGEMMQSFQDVINKYLNDCIHSNNEHLNRYFNEQTEMIEQNIQDDEMVVMLDIANQIALQSSLHMQVTHTQDEKLILPFTEKLNKYLAYSKDLLRPLIP